MIAQLRHERDIWREKVEAMIRALAADPILSEGAIDSLRHNVAKEVRKRAQQGGGERH